MALIAPASQYEDKPRPLAPKGLQSAVCAFVEDLGECVTTWEGKSKITRKVVLVFELAKTIPASFKDAAGKVHEVDPEIVGKPFMLSADYTFSMGEKANLRRDVNSWLGEPLSDEAARAFDLESLVGQQMTLNVIHKASKATGKVSARIAGLNPAMEGALTLTVQATEPPKWIESRRAKNREEVAAFHGAGAAEMAALGDELAEHLGLPAETFADGSEAPF